MFRAARSVATRSLLLPRCQARSLASVAEPASGSGGGGWRTRIRYAAVAGGVAVLAVGAGMYGIRCRSEAKYRALREAAAQDKGIQHWVPPSRAQLLADLKASPNQPYDLLIIGGGSTGAGCALEAASRGLRVAMIERDDFASGTSSRSTKLVHGGVRYLEKAFWELDIEQYRLVEEALAERSSFLHIASYLSQPLPIMLPIYKWYMVPYFWAGSKAYDLIAGSQGLESSYYLSRSKALEAFPMLKKERLVGAMVYYDGQQNDARMNVALALTSIYYGATVVNHAEVTGLLKRDTALPTGHPLRGPGRERGDLLYGATVKDALTGETFEVHAKGIVNATGPFSDAIRALDEPGVQKLVAPAAGTHIVLPSYYSPRNMGLIDPKTSDGRVLFFLPWQGNTIAGTTDSPSELTFEPTPSEKDIQFIIRECSNYFDTDIQVRRGDVLSAWSGLRPLVRDPAARNTESLVRSHLVHASPSGLLTIVGGKWTTYRNMAQETIDEAVRLFGLKPTRPSWTNQLLLLGTHGWTKTCYLRLIQQYGFDTEVAQHLTADYGDRAFAVAAIAELSDARWPVHGKRLVAHYPYIEAEVRYAVRHEYAETAIDVLARRTRLAFLNAHAALEALPKVIRIMSQELGWSSQRQSLEYASAKRFLKTMGLNEEATRSFFTKDQLAHYRTVFSSLAGSEDGHLRKADLPAALKKVHVTCQADKLTDVADQLGIDMFPPVDPANPAAVVDLNTFIEVIYALSPKDKIAQGPTPSSIGKVSVERSGGGV